MTEPTRGLLDTSVVIDHDVIDSALLPDESAISAVTLAELAAGPHATENKDERARRQDRLQWATATWEPLPGQTSRARLADLLIASTAAANGLPLYTRNSADFDALKRILKVVSV
jgi:predicted nucleic acid-binding protein